MQDFYTSHLGMTKLDKLRKLIGRLSCSIMGTIFSIEIDYDKKYTRISQWIGGASHRYRGRLYLQIIYGAPCTKTGEYCQFKGRKWYLSSHMTEDEVIKTAYAAFQACVNHEVMEGFKVDNIILFNPHISYKELLKISHKEISRQHFENTRNLL